MTRNTTIWVSWALLSLVLACACDSDSKGDTVAGVDKSKKVSDLTEDEIYDLCVYINEQDADVMAAEDTCMAIGLALISQGVDQSICEATVDACMQQANGAEEDPKEYCKGAPGDDELINCDATVGEMNDCVQDMKNLFSSNPLSGLNCSSSKETVEEAIANVLEDPELPASCQMMEKKCPGLLDDGQENSDSAK